MTASPRIVITVAVAALAADPERAARKNELYAAAVRRHGGRPILLDAATNLAERRRALDAMDGLLLSGGADLDPARYGAAVAGSQAVQPARDELEAETWAAAERQGLPVLGICRGLQAINVFLGGWLVQHVGGHDGPAFGDGPAAEHALRVVPGTRLARILFPTNVGGGVVRVNSYHHQGVTADGLAPGLVASAWATSPSGDLVEGIEASDGRLVLGVQCHPERAESTPPAFERVFRVFVDAARGAVGGRDRDRELNR